MGRIPKVDKERALEAAARKETFQALTSPDCKTDSSGDLNSIEGDSRFPFDDTLPLSHSQMDTDWASVSPQSRLATGFSSHDPALQDGRFRMYHHTNNQAQMLAEGHGRPVFPSADGSAYSAAGASSMPVGPLTHERLLEQRMFPFFKDSSSSAQSQSVNAQRVGGGRPHTIGENVRRRTSGRRGACAVQAARGTETETRDAALT